MASCPASSTSRSTSPTRASRTAIAVLQDARIELRTAVDHGIELAEKITAAAFRFTRKAVQRVDEAASETLSGAERVLGGAVKTRSRHHERRRAAREHGRLRRHRVGLSDCCGVARSG